MKFYLAELEMREAVEEAKTLEDFVRIGFSHVDYVDKKGERWLCYEMIGDHEVEGYPMYSKDPMLKRLDGKVEVAFCNYDQDGDGFTTVIVKEKVDEEV